MDTARIKQETGEAILLNNNDKTTSLSSSSSESSDDELSCVEQNPKKRPKITYSVLPVGFLDPLPLQERPLAPRKPIVTDKNGVVVSVVNPCGSSLSSSSLVKEESAESDNAAWVVKEKAVVISTTTTTTTVSPVMVRGCKQFWKAGDYEGTDGACSVAKTAGMDHVRVHPKFLHSNATSHKWALGAFAELLDNALDEVCSGATYVLVDVLENMKDHNKMLLVEDNGGGMTPDKMRQCMSLGYSAKSKMANTIGQYGNGFKTSTMRLGADVIVFSRCQVKNGGSTTQSIGMLSYTFLRSTGKEDIVVPMIHYEKVGETWNKQVNYSSNYWQTNLESIVMWSPYESEEDLLDQFNSMKDQGTRIIIYNLWEDDQGSLELDFDTDLHDIQIRGVSRDEKKIQMAKVYPNSRHFLTYRHSLRSYASILYYKIPPGFQIILRGEKVDHHNIVDDMMHTKEITYKPLLCADAASKDLNMVAVVKIGFVKDAEHHIDIQGFNVYHKNRLIKPFWRVWNAAGSDGRGVIGVLEANFVEPAHDKQGFERTVVLSRLESKLVSVQKTYWSTNCQLIGYAERRRAKTSISPDKVSPADAKDKCNSTYNANGNINSNHTFTFKTTGQTENRSPVGITHRSPVGTTQYQGQARYCGSSSPCPRKLPSYRELEAAQNVPVKTEEINRNGSRLLPLRATPDLVLQLKEENNLLRTRLKKFSQDFQYEKEKNKSLQNQVIEMKQKMDKMDEEQETFVSCFSEERKRRDTEEENLRRKIKEASEVIQQLIKKEKL